MNLTEKVTIRLPKELLANSKICAMDVDCKLSEFIRLAITYSVESLEK
jgi:hypothetical protein